MRQCQSVLAASPAGCWCPLLYCHSTQKLPDSAFTPFSMPMSSPLPEMNVLCRRPGGAMGTGGQTPSLRPMGAKSAHEASEVAKAWRHLEVSDLRGVPC